MNQIREKCDSLALSRADFCMVGRCHPWYSVFSFFIFFSFRSNGKKEDGYGFRDGYGNYFRSAVRKVT